MTRPSLGRRLLAETVGTGLLVTVVVGSGIAAADLSPANVGLQLFYNSTATVFGAAPAVGAYIGAAYWFTSSTSFANASVSVGPAFSDTFAGIAPGSVPGFVVAELVGGGLGVALVRALYPDVAAAAADVVVPHGTTVPSENTTGRARR